MKRKKKKKPSARAHSVQAQTNTDSDKNTFGQTDKMVRGSHVLTISGRTSIITDQRTLKILHVSNQRQVNLVNAELVTTTTTTAAATAAATATTTTTATTAAAAK